jgi:hypothetical protein
LLRRVGEGNVPSIQMYSAWYTVVPLKSGHRRGSCALG